MTVLGASIVAVAGLVSGRGVPADLQPAGDRTATIDFRREIEPLLKQECVLCHGPALAQGGLRLDSREAALKGGASGPALVPGDSGGSLFVKRLVGAEAGVRMPMNLDPWSAEKVALVRTWIDQGAPWTAVAAKAPDFAKDVQPILRANCVVCHGPGEQRQNLRLDARSLALKGGLSGRVIVPGKGAESLIVRRLRGQVAPRMPFEKEALAPSQIAVIESWIDAGAPGPDDAPAEAKVATHWSYVKPVRPALPAVQRSAWVENPIDAFVLARLEKEKIEPSPEAGRETLIRRVSLDLIGLPPTVAEIDGFVGDASPDAYERVVDRLLASPGYGERWARPWLDLARYADSNGYEKDRLRTAWKFRDWVIGALNQDMSFRDFTIEQIAGDMLKDATVDQRIATGFHRNTLLNQEGGIDVEEARFETLVDRVNTTGAVWLGSTVGCAQCHNHKFDPFSQKDYYRLMAFYDNVDYSVHGVGEVVMDKWIEEPEIDFPTPEQARERELLRASAEKLKTKIEKGDLEASLQAWERELAGAAPRWTPLVPLKFVSKEGAVLEAHPDRSLSASGGDPEKDVYSVTARTALAGVTAFRLEALPDPALPGGGPGRSNTGNFVLTGLSVRAGARPVVLVRAGADINEDGRAAQVLDSDPISGWGISAETGKPHFLIVQAARPLAPTTAGGAAGAASPTTLTFTLAFEGKSAQHALGRFRLSATTAANPWGGLPVPTEIRAILDTPRPQRTAEQNKELLGYFRGIAPSLDAPRDRLAQTQRRLDDLKIPTALVMKERPGFERPSTPLRNRGSFMSPGDRVFAAVPAVFGPLPDDQPPNRLGLARWLVSDDNPLTARVTVNRIWESLFGRGLVLTSEDFGSQGDSPSHPELLDWLAVEFMEKGWSQKALLRTIVTSATYRQASRATSALIERDPDNRLLARGPRFRMEAEMVRDAALAAAGLLSAKIGGPSVFPVQPEGIWNNPYSDERWRTSEGEDRHRRSLYTFIRRTSPYPSAITFDAPSREFCTVRRVRTNTPLQALTTLNDPVFVEAARHLARRIIIEAGPDARARAAYGFRLCTARVPEAEEVEPLLAFHERESERFLRDAEAARAVVGDDASTSDAPDRAAWIMVANVLLSLDETLTKE